MDPLLTKAISATASALVKKIFNPKRSARLVDKPVQLGPVVRLPWNQKPLAAKQVAKLVRSLMLALADADASIRAIEPAEGEALISSLTSTLLALDTISMDLAQAADLDENVLAGMLKGAVRPDAIKLYPKTEALYDEVLTSCCLNIVEHFTSAPEFILRSQVERSRKSGRTERVIDDVAEGVEALLEVVLQETAVEVWTGDDFRHGTELATDGYVHPIEDGEPVDLAVLRMGRLNNLQLEFDRLGKIFDAWLAGTPRKRNERVRIFWIEDQSSAQRSKALLACLSRCGGQDRLVLDAGGDLELALRVWQRSTFNPGFDSPPIISVDLPARAPSAAWVQMRNMITRARTQHAARDLASSGTDIYPRIVIAGTKVQRRAANEPLPALLEVEAVDTRGLPGERAHSYHGLSGLESKSLSGEAVYNRGLPVTTRKLVGRKTQLALLRDAWMNNKTRIVSIVASGGTGKSALVNTWLREMRTADYLGATRVLAWSFYSQGTKEDLVSADPFINFGLERLGAGSSVTESPTKKGVRLASLMRRDNYLLVLDGMEPLQHPPTAPDIGGRITDDSLKALLEELAKSADPGLCVITTRVPLTDLRDLSEELGASSIVEIELDNLRDDEAATLLRRLIQKKPSLVELVEATRSVENHALAVTLLGNYLRDVHDGDLAGRFDLRGLSVEIPQGGHARRIMTSYVQWLQEYRRVAELAVLNVIGLFDRPAPEEAMQALLGSQDLDPFTSEHDRVGSLVWHRCVEALRGMGLLNGEIPDSPGTLDAHPLVREHFRDQLHRAHPEKWINGNARLFSYYQDHAPTLPTDSKGMSELYAAVTHGSAANLHQEVYAQVLLSRVWRDKRKNFATRQLGMTGSDLVALSNYFEPRQWRCLRPVSISDEARTLIMTNTGVRLRQLGRLSEARECFGSVVDAVKSETASPEEYDDAAYAAGQYCELLVIAGALRKPELSKESALDSGKRAVAFGDLGQDPYFRMHSRSSLGEVYFMLGEYGQAKKLFDEAKAIKGAQPFFLYSQGLFRYGYYMIETGRVDELFRDKDSDAGWGTNGNDSSLLSKAIRFLIVGAMHRCLMEGGDQSLVVRNEAEQALNEAIVAFRDAGYSDYLVRGLLERAHFYRVRGWSDDYTLSLRDLDQADFEARRGQMRLLRCDVLLQRSATYSKFASKSPAPKSDEILSRATSAAEQAGQEVDRLDYGRRRYFLRELRVGLGMS